MIDDGVGFDNNTAEAKSYGSECKKADERQHRQRKKMKHSKLFGAKITEEEAAVTCFWKK